MTFKESSYQDFAVANTGQFQHSLLVMLSRKINSL